MSSSVLCRTGIHLRPFEVLTSAYENSQLSCREGQYSSWRFSPERGSWPRRPRDREELHSEQGNVVSAKRRQAPSAVSAERHQPSSYS